MACALLLWKRSLWSFVTLCVTLKKKKNQEHLLRSWEFHIKSQIVRVLLVQYWDGKATGYIRWNRPFVTGQCDIGTKDRLVSL